MTIYEKIEKAIEARKARSAWERGVNLYAIELLENISSRASEEGRDPANADEAREWMLNGAEDWYRYSYSGFALITGPEIAVRLGTPSEIRRTRNGERPPHRNEAWLDVQVCALYQAARIVSGLLHDLTA